MLSEPHDASVLLDSDDPYGLSARNDDPTIQERIDRYWESRSRGYNHVITLLLKNTAYYDALFDSLIPPGRKGRVLDIARLECLTRGNPEPSPGSIDDDDPVGRPGCGVVPGEPMP